MIKYSDFIYPVSLVYDHEVLLSESMINGYDTYVDPISDSRVEGWLIRKVTSGYAMSLCKNFADMIESTDCRPRFYILEPGHSIVFHKDRGTLCSLNIILSGSDDPISFRDFNISYKMALLNTQKEHAVISPSSQRILFKLSIFDKTFDEVRDILSSKSLTW